MARLVQLIETMEEGKIQLWTPDGRLVVELQTEKPQQEEKQQEEEPVKEEPKQIPQPEKKIQKPMREEF